MKKYIILITVLLLALAVHQQAQGVTKVGTTAAPFLVIDVGPRGTGMGSAFVSLANDATAMYWNPAGIARLSNFNAVFCNSNWIADLAYNYAGAVFPLGNYGNLGLSATFLTMDQMERTTIASPDGTGEFFDAGSYALSVSYGRNLTNQFAIGISAKYINERLYHTNATGVALDLGALFDTGFHGLTLGMNIANYGSKMQLDGRDLQVQHDVDETHYGNDPNTNARLLTDRFDLPLMFRFGVSMDVLRGSEHNSLVLAVDALHPSDDVEYLNVGGEYVFYKMFSLRGGLKELFSNDTEQGFTFGGGLRYAFPGSNMKLSFDYSYLDFGVLNSIHMISVGMGL
jgi:hypothetical protein